MLLIDLRNEFQKMGDSALSKYGALLWTLDVAPRVGLELAFEEHRLGMGHEVPPPFVSRDDDALRGRSGTISMERCRFAAESAVRYLHASGDLLAQLIRVTLLADTELGEDCRRSDVLDGLRERPELSSTVTTYQEFLGSPPFRYAEDACNRLKHRDWMAFKQWAHMEELGGPVTSGTTLAGCRTKPV